MSSIKLSPNASGTGIFTVAAPNSNTDRTLTLPDATGTIQVSGNPISGTTASFSGDVTLGSSVLATPSGSAPSYLCRAWVNFNGTGTVAIRASGNVSSITDNGTGDYTVNFTTAMSDTNYAAVITCGVANETLGLSAQSSAAGARATSSFRFVSQSAAPSTQDSSFANIAIFR